MVLEQQKDYESILTGKKPVKEYVPPVHEDPELTEKERILKTRWEGKEFVMGDIVGFIKSIDIDNKFLIVSKQGEVGETTRELNIKEIDPNKMTIYRGQGENRSTVTVYDHGISADTNPPAKPVDSTTLPPVSVKTPEEKIEEKDANNELLGYNP